MTFGRLALVALASTTLLACGWLEWDRNPDRCKEVGIFSSCDGPFRILTERRACVDDDHVETVAAWSTTCSAGTLCSEREHPTACVVPRPDDWKD